MTYSLLKESENLAKQIEIDSIRYSVESCSRNQKYYADSIFLYKNDEMLRNAFKDLAKANNEELERLLNKI